MKISIISVFPQLHESFINSSLIKRAQDQGLLEFNLFKFSDFCEPKERIDEPSCGPGSGMIIKPSIVEKAIEHVKKSHGSGIKIFFSPQGKKLDQNLLRKFSIQINIKKSYSSDTSTNSQKTHLILICARYEGMDSRVEQFYADEIISIGDYVLMGGDVAAQVFLEGFLRLVPGIVGKVESVENESFNGPFLDYPEYGLPIEWNGQKVPDIVLSGNHAAIKQWRDQKKAENTILNRFDWLRTQASEKKDIDLAREFIPTHYAALMHNDVYVKDQIVGNTSITSIDIHDIARSSATYDIKNYFVVSELQDQQIILNTFLNFWQSESGKEYNPSRHAAVERVIPTQNFNDVIEAIKEKENKDPIIIATSAKPKDNSKVIDYFSQDKVWKENRPVLFIFGTGQGLSDEIIDRCDYLLLPIVGISDYNHLSVRSAAAIIFDRWFGLNKKL